MIKNLASTEEKRCKKFYFYFIFLKFKSPIRVSRFEINWSAIKIRSPQASGRVLIPMSDCVSYCDNFKGDNLGFPKFFLADLAN